MFKTQKQSIYIRTLDILDQQSQYIDQDTQMSTNYTFYSHVE